MAARLGVTENCFAFIVGPRELESLTSTASR
jgi:hypothetical protein